MKLFETLERKIYEMLDRRRAIRTFERYVSPGVIKQIEKPISPGESPRLPEQKHFQFVVADLDENSPDAISSLLGNIVELMVSHNAMISSVSPSLVIAWLGAPFPQHDSAETRLTLVAALLAQNRGQVRIAHGQCDGLVGIFGGRGRWTYGVAIPHFSEILRNLLDSPFGTATEIP